MATVAARLEIVGSGIGGHLPDTGLEAPFDDFNDAFAHAGDQQIPVVRCHDDARGRCGNRHHPGDLLCSQVNGHDFIGVLEGHENELAGVVEGHVRGRARRRQAGLEPEVHGVVEIDPVET